MELYTRQQQLARLQMKLEGTHDRFNAFARFELDVEESNAILVHHCPAVDFGLVLNMKIRS